MNTAAMRTFAPFRVESDRVILSPPDEWRKPLEWQREADAQLGEWRRGDAWLPVVNVLVLPDLFAHEQTETVLHPSGDLALRCDYCGKAHPDNRASDSLCCECGRFLQRVEWMTVADVFRDITTLIDRCSLLTFWLPTRHPERVRERWPQVEVDIEGAYTPDGRGQGPHGKAKVTMPRPNVRLGLYASEEYMFRESMIEQFLDLAGGAFVMTNETVEVIS